MRGPSYLTNEAKSVRRLNDSLWIAMIDIQMFIGSENQWNKRPFSNEIRKLYMYIMCMWYFVIGTFFKITLNFFKGILTNNYQSGNFI